MGSGSLGVRLRGTLGDIDPLKKGPLLREPYVGLGRVPFKGVSGILPRNVSGSETLDCYICRARSG